MYQWPDDKQQMHFVAVLMLMLICCSADANADACRDKNSNAETRQCYFKEQLVVNRQADAAAQQIESRLRKDAAQETKEQNSVVADTLRKSASALAQSQAIWSYYRDMHCKAVMYSWTTGSGAGTAYEQCMYEIGRSRLVQLKADFPD